MKMNLAGTLCSLSLVAFAACGGSGSTTGTSSGSGTATTGSGSGSSSGNGSGSGSGSSSGGSSSSGSLTFNANGTFTASGPNGSASATLAPVLSIAQNQNTANNAYQLILTDTNDPSFGGGTITFSNPTPGNIQTQQFSVAITFPSTPATGTFTDMSSGYCGTVVMSYATSSVSSNLQGGPNLCPSTGAYSGSWSLTLSSLTLLTAGQQGNQAYSAHGSLSANLTDGMGNTGMVSLTF